MRQDPDYHRFADDRVLLGIPNAADVLSSGAFLLVGILGLVALWRGRVVVQAAGEARAYLVFFAAVAATGLGSAFYHLAPDDFGLMLDRLPIAIAVMALLAIVITERVGVRAGETLLFPLCVLGAASVLYWSAFDDLRAYGIVQFGGIAAMLAASALRASRYSRGETIFVAAALYGVGKAFELSDRAVFELTGVLSGHTLKHLLSAGALSLILWSVVRRQLSQPSSGRRTRLSPGR
jgi:hypothetical protein